MVPKLPHSIRRQYLEVELIGSESDALALQGRLSALFMQWLAPVIEQVLDRYSPAQGILRIERLDIDIGSIPLGRLEQDLPEILRQSVEIALDENLSRNGRRQSTPHEGATQDIDMLQALDEALAWFLQYGTLPDTLYLAQGMNLETTLMAAWAAPGSASSAPLAPLLLQALEVQVAVERLTRRFTTRFQQALLSRMSSSAAAAAALACQRSCTELLAAGGIGVERLLYQVAFERALHAKTCSVDALVEDAMHLAAAVSGAKTSNPGQGRAHGSRTLDMNDEDMGATPQNTVRHPDEEEGIFIDNAGLVLLHPFLGRLFEKLKLSDGQCLLQPGRALALLHFLASGQTEVQEYQLALPKLLCWLPLAENVQIDVVLGAEETDEAQGLLQAVVGHWTALRNTSVDGLRGAFLLRPGKLHRRNGEWVLQVEQQTADILMSELPWGVSAIRLPWMEQILWVEWA